MDYSNLVGVYESLESTTKRLAYTDIISKFIREIPEEDLDTSLLLLEGRVFPRWDEREIGVASKLMVKAISLAAGVSTSEVEKEMKKAGDLGTAAQEIFKTKKQVTLTIEVLSVKKVFQNLQKLSTIEGSGSVDRKMQIISQLLTSSKPNEAKFIVRTILNDMRIGVGEGTLRDAIVWAFFGKELGASYDYEENKVTLNNREEYNKYVGEVQHAYDLSNEFGPVAKAAKKLGLKGLKDIEMHIGTPIKVMLALKVESPFEGFERCGKPAEFEFKYDGMRMQVHRDGDNIEIFTRRLENITKQFPEVVSLIKTHIQEKKFIIDAEAVGYSNETGKYLPFQNISQRIKRKYDIDKMARDYPVELNVFDIINYRGKSIIDKPFSERKDILKKIVKAEPKKICLAKSIITDDEKEVNKFYKEALDSGNEGLMIKKLDAPYKPGSRVGFMVKLKPTRENLDLVIIRAEWGEGKRSSWLSSYTLACKDDQGNFLEVGKVSTGLKEKPEEGLSFGEMTKLLEPLIQKDEGKEVVVKPEIIIEIGYEEIQKSPTYTSGFALRFPRVIQLREDRGVDDITTLDMVEDAYSEQLK